MAVAFANILYGAPLYKKYIPQLSRLMIGSNAVQQLVVTPLSSLRFTVGQVQDIGLIFLNAMTKDIADRLDGEAEEKIVGTAILASCFTTILLGLTLYLVGRCGRATGHSAWCHLRTVDAWCFRLIHVTMFSCTLTIVYQSAICSNSSTVCLVWRPLHIPCMHALTGMHSAGAAWQALCPTSRSQWCQATWRMCAHDLADASHLVHAPRSPNVCHTGLACRRHIVARVRHIVWAASHALGLPALQHKRFA